MKRIFLLPVLILAAAAQLALAQSAPTQNEASLLWEVSGNGLQAPSYVYGTIHLIPRKDFFLTEATKSALEKAGKVVFEINIEKMMDLTAMLPLLMQSFMKNDTTLKQLLSPEEYGLVKTHFSQLGLPMFMLDRIKPMFLSAMDPQSMMGGGADQEAMTSYEMELLAIAQTGKKKIDGLETAAYQMSMFDSIPYRIQAKMLLESIQQAQAEEGGAESEFTRMVNTYKQQDIEGMQRMLDADADISAYENLLLINRNRNWIPVMMEMMDQQICFFAVGAGHLGGRYGVLQLLREQGYSVQPLK